LSPTKTSHITDRLREEITAGRWKAGERLPVHAELADQFGVSVMTIREAVRQLVSERLLMTLTSRGTIVRSREVLEHVVTDFIRPDRPASPASDVFVETVQAAGRAPHKEFSMRMEPASPEVARWLGLVPNDWVVARTLMQYVDGEPWTWEISYYPRALAEEIGLDTPTDIPEGTTRRMADRGHGETGWRDINGCRPATPEEADKLSVPTGVWIQDYIRIGANDRQITRVTRDRRLADQNSVVHELGDDQALTVIRDALNRADTPEESA
jgi:GntR family transcriptional regulator